MEFTESEVQEFKTEAQDLMELAEQSLIALDQGAGLDGHYNSIFRAFHSIKGAAGMMEMTALQSHMHQLENLLVAEKAAGVLSKAHIDLFLRGLDACRGLLEGQSITFSYDLVAAAAVPSPIKADFVSEVVVKKGRLLIVDDEPDLVEIFSEMLRAQGFDVMGTTYPEQVVNLVRSFEPDTVLTDMSMPKMTGLDVLREIRKVNSDLPVIFVSAHLDKDVLAKAIDLGVYAVVEKPFEIMRVLQICLNSVRRYQLNQLFNKSVNLLLYQFSDLADYLTSTGKNDVRETLSREITEIMHQRRQLRRASQAS